MSTGQMMMVIGAFMIFGVVALNFSDTSYQSTTIMDSNAHMQTATTIARSMIDEISQLPFDAGFAGKKVVRLTDLTACGNGSWETYPNFNDIDDFEGKMFVSPPRGTTPSTTPRCLWGTERDTVRCRVQYVSQTYPDVATSSYTWSKRITVTVTSGYAKDRPGGPTRPVTLSQVVSY